jgi:creatinine amidohydrolase
MRIATLTAPEVAEAAFPGDAGTAILPMGSTETHGPGLPMGDYLIAEAIALGIAARHGGALVAPPLPFGGADFFQRVPGAIALSTATLTRVVEEALMCLIAGGFNRILIVNGHGGSIPAIEEAQRALRLNPGAVIPALHLWRNAGGWQEELGGDPAALGHGGDPVASVALHLFPEWCRPEAFAPRQAAAKLFGQPIANFGAIRLGGAEFNLPTHVEQAAPGGVYADDPRGANAAHGAAIVERLVAAGAAMLRAMEQPE